MVIIESIVTLQIVGILIDPGRSPTISTADDSLKSLSRDPTWSWRCNDARGEVARWPYKACTGPKGGPTRFPCQLGEVATHLAHPFRIWQVSQISCCHSYWWGWIISHEFHSHDWVKAFFGPLGVTQHSPTKRSPLHFIEFFVGKMRQLGPL
jgi:hypothetical protein